MKQKVLTEKQHEIIGRIEKLLKEADENGIKFVYDIADLSLTAFNGENVSDFYSYYGKDENGNLMDWDSASILEDVVIESFNSNVEDFYLVFD